MNEKGGIDFCVRFKPQSDEDLLKSVVQVVGDSELAKECIARAKGII